MKPKLIVIALALTLGACTSTKYTDPSGATFTRNSFLTKQALGHVEVAVDPKTGEKKLVLDGYSNEQTEIAAIAANAVAKALSVAK